MGFFLYVFYVLGMAALWYLALSAGLHLIAWLAPVPRKPLFNIAWLAAVVLGFLFTLAVHAASP